MSRGGVFRVLWLLALLANSSCTNGPPRAAQAAQGSVRPAFAWHYRARLEAYGELVVEGRFDGATDGEFMIYDELARYVRQFEVAQGDAWQAVELSNASWRVPCSSGCAIRYRFALRDVAQHDEQPDTAFPSGDAVVSPPSTWLLHPVAEARDGLFELTVDPGPHARFVSAFQPVSGGEANHYQAPIAIMDDASFAAFGPLEVTELAVGDSTVQLAVAPFGLGLSTAQVEAWVLTSAGAIASYYQGHLPAKRTLVLVIQGGGQSTRGLTLGGGGPGVLIRAAERITPASTRDDWVVTHELLHANFPDVGPAHSWLSEGLSTYLEPIIRARAGLVSEAKVWRDMIDGMPKGLPEPDDEGLENTRTWGRTYWGGAMFCLLADLELREKTGNRHSLDDVLLAIGKTGDTDEDYWPIERVLEMAERATRTQVLRDLYERLGKKPGTVDLNQLFTRLGVRVQGDSVVFDEHAPLAALRKSIAARRPG
jgi:hypothetical protein